MTKIPLMEAQHLAKSFAIEGGLLKRTLGYVHAVQDVSFSIAPGETMAIVGGSGCGKTTIAKMVASLLSPNQGRLLWEGVPLTTLSRVERARHIQMIFQDPFASLNPKLSVGVQLGEALRIATGVVDVRKRAAELLESVGIEPDALVHYPFQFSGGQRQRIAIARALAPGPALLIADEPLSALDVSVQAQILDLFTRLKKSLGLTILFITHDLVVASLQADRVIVLQDGRIVEEGPADETLRHPQHLYTRALLDAVPSVPV